MIDPSSAPTITLEFGLYCDNAWKKGLLGTSLFVSATLTAMFMGVFADIFGRKKACMFCLFFGSAGTMLIAAA